MRLGFGPCRFIVPHDLSSTIDVPPRIGDAGNLVMAIDQVNLRG